MLTQLVIFSVNNEDFGVEITQVKEIIKPMEIFQVPNAPEFIEGLINLRDKVYTIFSLRKKFHLLQHEFDDKTKIVISNINSLLLGFIVDGVKEIIKIDSSRIEATPKAVTIVSDKYLSGIAKIDNRIILILDLNKVISESEQSELQELLLKT